MLAVTLARAGNGGDDLEPGRGDRCGEVRLMLTQETPQDCAKPRCQPVTHARVDVVLVVPQLMGELLTAQTPRPGGRTGMRWLRYGSLSSTTVAT
jgi:hypothetical protein